MVPFACFRLATRIMLYRCPPNTYNHRLQSILHDTLMPIGLALNRLGYEKNKLPLVWQFMVDLSREQLKSLMDLFLRGNWVDPIASSLPAGFALYPVLG